MYECSIKKGAWKYRHKIWPFDHRKGCAELKASLLRVECVSRIASIANLVYLWMCSVYSTRMNYIRFKWTISLCVLKANKNSKNLCIVWFCTIKSMIIVRKYTYVKKRERERANHFKILSHVCEHARRASTRLASHALTGSDFDSSSDWKHTHRGSIASTT